MARRKWTWWSGAESVRLCNLTVDFQEINHLTEKNDISSHKKTRPASIDAQMYIIYEIVVITRLFWRAIYAITVVEDTEKSENPIQEPDRVRDEQSLLRHAEYDDEDSRRGICTPHDRYR